MYDGISKLQSEKNPHVVFHYKQSGGIKMNQQLPVSVATRGPVTYFSINYNGHKKFNNFFQEDVVDDFLQGLYNCFNPNDEYKFQGYAEIINKQKDESVVSEITRVWPTNVYTAKYLNPYVRDAIKNDILKKIVLNGETGSSWVFKRFKRLQIITSKDIKVVISG